MCDQLGIEKRHTTPYHPQADGLAERSIGWVKQVARCLMADRHLNKGSWPSLLPEITFYCNNVENESTKYSPHMLCYGRQPTSPLDAGLRLRDSSRRESPQEYVDSLQKQRDELYQLVRENDRESQAKAKMQYDRSKKPATIKEGEHVFVRKGARSDGLEPMFEGPFKVLRRQGATVKVDMGRSAKWIHLNRCKLYVREDSGSIVPSTGEEDDMKPGVECHENVELENNELVEVETNETEQELSGERGAEVAAPEVDKDLGQERRYPKRQRKTNQKYTEDYWGSRPLNRKPEENANFS